MITTELKLVDEPAVETRVCTKCGVEHPATLEFFYQNKKPGTLRGECKDCTRAYARAPGRIDPEITAKVCTKCGEEFPATKEYFAAHVSAPNGLRARCKACSTEDFKLKYWANPEAAREKNRKICRANYNPAKNRRDSLKRNYGLTPEQFDDMVDEQQGCCAICRSDEWVGNYRVPHVDHDHETGRIRGLLCGNCNVAIGMMGDDPERLVAAAAYLLKHKNSN